MCVCHRILSQSYAGVLGYDRFYKKISFIVKYFLWTLYLCCFSDYIFFYWIVFSWSSAAICFLCIQSAKAIILLKQRYYAGQKQTTASDIYQRKIYLPSRNNKTTHENKQWLQSWLSIFFKRHTVSDSE